MNYQSISGNDNAVHKSLRVEKLEPIHSILVIGIQLFDDEID